MRTFTFAEIIVITLNHNQQTNAKLFQQIVCARRMHEAKHAYQAQNLEHGNLQRSMYTADAPGWALIRVPLVHLFGRTSAYHLSTPHVPYGRNHFSHTRKLVCYHTCVSFDEYVHTRQATKSAIFDPIFEACRYLPSPVMILVPAPLLRSPTS